MYFQWVVSFVYLTVSVSGYSSSNRTLAEVVQSVQQSEMEMVGQIGNKVYFLSLANSSWMGGQQLCQNSNLKYAKIETQDEFDFIQSQTSNNGMWIGGRLKGQEDTTDSYGAFEWEDGSEYQPFNFIHSSGEWLCLMYNNHVVYPRLCLYGQEYPALCQILLG